MHPQQKAAWFSLIVVLGTVVVYGAAVPTLSWWFHRTLAEAAVPAMGVFGLVGLTGFARFFYHAPKGGPLGKEPVMDERDRLLSTQAWSTGMAIFWLFFVFAGMGTWAYLYYVRGLERVTLPVGIFPVIIVASFLIFTLANALATLHAYGWTANDASK
jgi:hypothetical protein